MLHELERTGARFSLLLFLGFMLTPVVGYAAAILFDMLSIWQFQQVLAAGIVPAFSVSLVFLSLLQMQRLITPLTTWALQHPQGGHAPGQLQRQFQRFNTRFWSLLAVHVLVSPLLVFWSLDGSISENNALAVVHLMLLQMFTTLLAGTPPYLFGLQQLGKFAGHLSLERIHISLKTRTLLLAGLVPVLSYSLLVYYQWLQTGQLESGYIIIWIALMATTVTISLLSISSSQQALAPFQTLFSRSGASTHEELSRLRPASTDEIGHLTQILGKVFQRLGNQETHIRTIIDTAAEGIIVIDAAGLIDTFNAAAERLFGYRAQEIRGRHLASLLPGIFEIKQQINEHCDEREVNGSHHNGSLFQCSLRVSAMQISGKRMFTCLVADISRRKQVESELQETESRYRELVETAHDLVWSIDLKGCWSYLNAASKMIYGLAPEDMLGRPVIEFCAPDNLAADQDALQALMLHGEDLYQYKTTHLDRQGCRRRLSFNARAQRDANGQIQQINGTARDITDQEICQQEQKRTAMRVARHSDTSWASRVRDMLEQDKFQLVYQPIIALGNNQVKNYEVLVRMQCDDEIILPDSFIPAAERFGLIHGVDRWIVKRALEKLACLHAQGENTGFSINLSGKAFEDIGLLPMIQSLLDDVRIDPAKVCFEITETAAIAKLSEARKFIETLKSMGCQFALDDFGTGFSSFAYLKNLPIDILKIDGSFVQDITASQNDQTMVKAMHQVAHALGKKTTAECVENATTLELLRSYGVDYAQGNHIGKPREALMNITRPPLKPVQRVS